MTVKTKTYKIKLSDWEVVALESAVSAFIARGDLERISGEKLLSKLRGLTPVSYAAMVPANTLPCGEN